MCKNLNGDFEFNQIMKTYANQKILQGNNLSLVILCIIPAVSESINRFVIVAAPNAKMRLERKRDFQND